MLEAMAKPAETDITGMLAAWSDGDVQALDRLVEIVYPELRQIARQHLARRPPDESLESAALANEAYLKLVRAGGIRCENRLHFLALCAQIVRRILVDHARRRASARHGGRAARVPLDQSPLLAPVQNVDVLAVDEALDALARVDARKSRVVELRFFGGLSLEEVAVVLGVSAETVKRDWRMARAWLLAELERRDVGSNANSRIRPSP